MKKSELRQIIKEEYSKLLKEDRYAEMMSYDREFRTLIEKFYVGKSEKIKEKAIKTWKEINDYPIGGQILKDLRNYLKTDPKADILGALDIIEHYK